MNHIYWALGVEKDNEPGATQERISNSIFVESYHFGSDITKPWHGANWLWLWLPGFFAFVLEIAATLPRELILRLNIEWDELKNYFLKELPAWAIPIYLIWAALKIPLMMAQVAAEALAIFIHTITRPIESLRFLKTLVFGDKGSWPQAKALLVWFVLSASVTTAIYLLGGSVFISALAETLASVGIVITAAATWQLIIAIALIIFLPSLLGQLFKAFNDFKLGFPDLKSIFTDWFSSMWGTPPNKNISTTATPPAELNEQLLPKGDNEIFDTLRREQDFSQAYIKLLKLFKSGKTNKLPRSFFTPQAIEFEKLLDLVIEITDIVSKNPALAKIIHYDFTGSFGYILFLESEFNYAPSKAQQLEKNLELIFHAGEAANVPPPLPQINTKDIIKASKPKGAGSYSKFYQGTFNNAFLGIKEFQAQNADDLHTVFQERWTLTYLNKKLKDEGKSGEYIIELFYFSLRFQDSPTPSLFMELAEVPLNIVYQRNLTREQVRAYLLQMISGLMFIHRAGILHRDIKPENLLLIDGKIKYCDFGAAVFKSHLDVTSFQNSLLLTSPAYASLESLQFDLTPAQLDDFLTQQNVYSEFKTCQPYSEASDTYSWGVVAVGLMTGTLPWGIQFNQKVVNILPKFLAGEKPFMNAEAELENRGFPVELRVAILNTWDYNPSKRTSLKDLHTAVTNYQPKVTI